MSITSDYRPVFDEMFSRVDTLEAERAELALQLEESRDVVTGLVAERDQLKLQVDALITHPDPTNLQRRIVRLDEEKAELEQRLLAALGR